MDLSYESLLLISAVIFAIYKYLRRNDDFFKKRGVKYAEPTLLFGNMFGLFTSESKSNGLSVFQELYNKFRNEKVFGMFSFMRPVFMVKDAEVLKQMMIKDFDHFVNHDSEFSAHGDRYFARSMLHLLGDDWREMRNALTPIFTSAKLKTIYHHLTSCAKDLSEHLEETRSKKGKIVIQTKDLFARYTAEVISTTALGFKGNCIKDPNSEVYQLAVGIQEDLASTAVFLKFLIIPTFPTLSKMLGIQLFRQSTHDFFKRYVTDEMTRRERQGVVGKNDVIQLLIQAKNDQLKKQASDKKLVTNWNDDELMTAQVFIFFAGGFDSTASLMNTMVWELAMNPEVQEELIREVDKVLDELDGNDVSYEALNKMKFMDMVVNETSRKFPPFTLNVRECNKDYSYVTEDGTKVEFKKGDQIFIPTQSLQHDPKYFENPSKFDPNRFSDDNKNSIATAAIQTFGEGPRKCIGLRLATIECKLAFFTILRKYSIEVCDKTPKQLTYSASPFAFNETVYVELKPRK